MAVPKPRYRDGSVQARQVNEKTTQATLSFFLILEIVLYEIAGNINLSCLYTAIPIPDFWHCHPYIPLHFLKMFFILVCVLCPAQ